MFVFYYALLVLDLFMAGVQAEKGKYSLSGIMVAAAVWAATRMVREMK